MTEPVRWGVLGASKFALEQMGPAIHAARGAKLAALASRSPAKADPFRDFCPDLRVHDSYDALLADPDIDAVYIPLPHTLHIEWGLKALDAGKHVLCEKPLAMAATDIDALIAKRDQTGLVAAEAFMIVHHPQWQRVQQMLSEGTIGTLIHVDSIFTYDNRADTTNIRNTAATGGGALPDIGVYTMGSTRFATGQEPQSVTADISYENGVDVISRVAAKFPDFTFNCLVSMRMFPRQEISFHGDEGLIRLTAPFNPNVFGPALIELHQPIKAVRIERFPAANHYVNQVETFCRAVRGEVNYPWALEDARGTQAMLDMVFAAAKAA